MPFTKDGVLVSTDGVVSVNALASGTAVPTTAIPLKGSAYPGGKMAAAADQSLYVRFV
jgi:hypothetical protein